MARKYHPSGPSQGPWPCHQSCRMMFEMLESWQGQTKQSNNDQATPRKTNVFWFDERLAFLLSTTICHKTTSEWTTVVLSSYPKLKYHLRPSIIRNIYQWWHIALASSPTSILSICRWQHGYKIIQTIIKPYQWAGCSLVWHCKLTDLTACRLQSQSSPFACLEALPTLSAHPCTRHMSWNGRWMSENLNGGRLIHGSSPQHRKNDITRCIWSFSPLL